MASAYRAGEALTNRAGWCGAAVTSTISRMPPANAAWPRQALHGLPFLLPPLALILVIWLQPEDHMGPYPDRAPWLRRAAYDDWDWSAMVLRGLNASLGRTAGRADNPAQIDEGPYARALDDPPPWQERTSMSRSCASAGGTPLREAT